MPVPAIKLSHHIPTIDLVRQFHETFEHPVAKELTAGNAKLRRLRVQLVMNELAELAQALGVPIELEVKPATIASDLKTVMNGMAIVTEWAAPPELCYADGYVDMVEAADALGDLDYVVQGGNLAFGIPAGLVMHAIHVSNMSKLDENGNPIYDENGKVVKGKNFHKPDIQGVLDTFNPATELL